jgi:hypothetical protein
MCAPGKRIFRCAICSCRAHGEVTHTVHPHTRAHTSQARSVSNLVHGCARVCNADLQNVSLPFKCAGNICISCRRMPFEYKFAVQRRIKSVSSFGDYSNLIHTTYSEITNCALNSSVKKSYNLYLSRWQVLDISSTHKCVSPGTNSILSRVVSASDE